MTLILVIEKDITLLDKLYRCFVLRCLYNALWIGREKRVTSGERLTCLAFGSAPVREGFHRYEFGAERSC